MDELRLEHLWRLSPDRDPKQIFSRILQLMVHIEETGSLAQVCEREGLSYRHAWGLLQNGEELFGTPLIEMSRGKGSRLTDAGRRLIHAEQRARERLMPLMAGLASDMLRQLEAGSGARTNRLQIAASHCLAMEQLVLHLQQQHAASSIAYCSSDEALRLLRNEQTDMAGFHAQITGTAAEPSALPRLGLNADEQMVLTLARRNLGLMLSKDNPKKIYGIRDLTTRSSRLIHRRTGSRMHGIFCALLSAAGLDAGSLPESCPPAETDGSVAACIAGGLADAGFGLEAAAQRYGLHFIPLTTDLYLLGISKTRLKQQQLQLIRTILGGLPFRQALNAVAGYDASQAGHDIV